MYALVRLLNGWQRSLTYSLLPEHVVQSGTLVRVPLQNRHEYALVEKIVSKADIAGTIRPIHSAIDLPHEYQEFIARASSYYALEPVTLYRRLFQFLSAKEKPNSEQPTQTYPCGSLASLTPEQEKIVTEIASTLNQQRFEPSLLHGVTGSGKTEVYAALLDRALAYGSALFLVPEVSVAHEMLVRLRARCSAPVYGLHAATSARERRAVWQAVATRQRIIIVGVHLPLMLPIHDLKLIIIDEEHADGFVEKQHPRISTRDCALIRAHIATIPIVLGSATPSSHALYSVRKHGWHYYQLTTRFAGAFPRVTHVLLKGISRKRKNFWISRQLEDALRDRLSKKEQSIIFINRRGYSFFIQCSGCSSVVRCNSCSVSLTLHVNHTAQCHYCGYTISEPSACAACQNTELLKKGIGTEQIVEILNTIFPEARIARGDLDTVSQKTRWQETVAAFRNHEIDILVGTQSITKGFDFPRVTLVGVIWADSNLSFPDYRSGEKALQQLIQVAGRAGRASLHSDVIIQSIADHEIFQHVDEQQYASFVDDELAHRQLLGYPPHMRMAEIELRASDESCVERDAHALKNALEQYRIQTKSLLRILGPARPPVDKIKNAHLRVIIIKESSANQLLKAYHACRSYAQESMVSFTPYPL